MADLEDIGPFIASILTCFLAEVAGGLYCLQSLQSPDLLPVMKVLLYVSLILDISKIVIAFIEILIYILRKMDITIWELLARILLMLGAAIAVLSIFMGICIGLFFQMSDLGDMPWLAVKYRIGVALYTTAKLLFFVTGIMIICWSFIFKSKKVWRVPRFMEHEMRRLEYMPIYYYG